MGRFMSPDFGGPVPNMPDAVPWADYENPQSLNLYSYGFNNPLLNTDDDGHDVNVCDNSGQCQQMTNGQYAAAQKADNGGAECSDAKAGWDERQWERPVQCYGDHRFQQKNRWHCHVCIGRFY
jgi:hypothetical protein